MFTSTMMTMELGAYSRTELVNMLAMVDFNVDEAVNLLFG